jgi:MFS family permease
VTTWDPAVRRVRALATRASRGSTEEFRTFAIAQFLHTAGDGAVALALANTLFFAVPLGEARGQVALYLLLTMAPYAVVAPLLGRLVDRSRLGGRRILIGGFVLRFLMAWALTVRTDSLLMFPLALVLLVASRAHGITRSSMVPELRPPTRSLMWANTWMSVVSSLGGAVGGLLAVAIVQVADSAGALVLATMLYGAGVLFAFSLPRHTKAHAEVASAADDDGPLVDAAHLAEVPVDPATTRTATLASERAKDRDHLVASLPSRVRSAGVAMAVIRVAVGYLTFFLAFVLKDEGAAALPAAIGAAALGGALGALFAPIGLRYVPQWVLPSVLLVLVAVAALWASTGLGIFTAMMIAGVVGLASAGGRLAFDSEVQHAAPPGARGRLLTRYEIIFQVGWVVGAFVSLPPYGARPGLVLLAVIAIGGFLAALRVHFTNRPVDPPRGL